MSASRRASRQLEQCIAAALHARGQLAASHLRARRGSSSVTAHVGGEEDKRDGISTSAHVGRREEQRWIHVVSSNRHRMVVSGNRLFFQLYFTWP